MKTKLSIFSFGFLYVFFSNFSHAVEMSRTVRTMPPEWNVETQMEFLSTGVAISPMLGPAFNFALNRSNSFGFKTLFGTSGGDSPLKGSYSAHLYWRRELSEHPSGLFFEPGIGTRFVLGEYYFNTELLIGTKFWLGDHFSLGGATGVEAHLFRRPLTAGSSTQGYTESAFATPKLILLAGFQF